MKLTQIYIDEMMYKLLEAKSKAEKKTISQLIRESIEARHTVLKLNLDAVFFCAQAEARQMLKTNYGKIINTSSMSAHIVNTPQHQVAYNTSKAGGLVDVTVAARYHILHGVRMAQYHINTL